MPNTDDDVPSPCPLCGGTKADYWATTRDVEYFSVEGDFRFYRCPDCDVLYVDPMLSDRLDEIYPGNYYSFTHALDSPVYRVKQWLDARLLRGILRGLAGETLAALDVGGGTGWQLSLVQRVDSRVRITQVVDIDDDAEAGAIEFGHRYFHGRIEEFETTQKFDLVLMLNLIEHVADPVGVLTRTADLLSPSGRILIKTPNFDSVDARIFRHRNWSGYHCPRHFVLFNATSFQAAAAKAGLAVYSLRHTQGAPFWSGSIINWLSAQGLARVDAGHPMLSHPLSTPLFAVGAALDFLRMPFSKTSQMFVILELAR